MAITSFKRYELKFIITKEQFEKLIPILKIYMESDKYCKDDNFYGIYNIYYDTPDNYFIRHSLSKPNHKEKLRLRSYNANISQKDKVFLEIKKKTAGIVHKRRAEMTLEEAEKFIALGEKPKLDGYMANQVANELEYFFQNNVLVPSVFIGYNRMAFFGKDDKEFRVTFDKDILARREKLSLEYTPEGERLLDDDKYLMEIKISNAVPKWLATLLSELKIYSSGFSKYGAAYTKYCLEKSNTDYNLYRGNVIIFHNNAYCEYIKGR